MSYFRIIFTTCQNLISIWLFTVRPRTGAERQKKYRECLKKYRPEKYEGIKKELAKKAKKSYKKLQICLKKKKRNDVNNGG